MKKHFLVFTFLISLLTFIPGCQVIGDIFKAGVGVGVFLVVIVIAIIIYFVSKMGKNK